MLLTEIQENECKICNSRITRESIRSIHSNGYGFEEREFACGKVLAFIPNFMRVEIKQECSKHPKYIEERNKRKDARTKVLELVTTLDVDEHWKKAFNDALDTHSLK